MKNDPLYQAVENMIPKPPTKQRGGGDNFLCDIENMLKGNCKKKTPEVNEEEETIVMYHTKYPIDGSSSKKYKTIFKLNGGIIEEDITNKGGRGKKYITNQRLSENPFSDSF